MMQCPLCAKARNAAKKCAYHQATTPQGLLDALTNDLKKSGARGLVRMVLAGQSRLVDLPPDLLDTLAEDTDQLADDFTKVLEKESFTSADLQLLAALSLVLAALHDDTDEPAPPAEAPIDEASP